MGKHRNKKSKKYICPAKGTVKYGEDKYVVLVIIAVLMIPGFVMLFNGIYEPMAVFFLLALPMIVFTAFMFRFFVKYDSQKRQIEYRKMFKFKTIDFDDIERIYKKSDTRTVFLIIKAKGHKVGMNMRSCNGARELQFLLKSRLPKKCEF